MHIDTAFLNDGVYTTAGAQPVLRAGGWGDYFEVVEPSKFRMRRP